MKKTISIIGVGRLGTQIARLLSENNELIISDKEIRKSRQVAKITKSRYENVDKAFSLADIILLLVPPEEVIDVIRENNSYMKPGTWLVNLATSVETRIIKWIVDREDLCVVGVKPITQARAMSIGMKTVLVTDVSDQEIFKTLKQVVAPIGPLIPGNEEDVGKINALATTETLKAAMNISNMLRDYNCSEDMIDAALHTVALGTLYDFPGDNENPYIKEKLQTIRFEQR